MELVEDDPCASACAWWPTADELTALPTPIKLSSSLADQILLARLSLSPESMTDDPELITVLAGMTKNQTLFEYLSGCWKRERAERSAVLQKKVRILDVRGFILTLAREPTPQQWPRSLSRSTSSRRSWSRTPAWSSSTARCSPRTTSRTSDDSRGLCSRARRTKPLGPTEFIPLLVPSQSTSSHVLTASDVPSLLNDLAIRFTPSAANDFEDASLHLIVGPVLETLGRDLFSSRSDIGGGGEGKTGWRESLGALTNLTEVKGVAGALPLTSIWSPASSVFGAPGIEVVTTLGPWLRLSAFPDSFVRPHSPCKISADHILQPAIAKTYFPNPSEMSRGDVESAWSNLRGTLRGLQVGLCLHLPSCTLLTGAELAIPGAERDRALLPRQSRGSARLLWTSRAGQREARCDPGRSQDGVIARLHDQPLCRATGIRGPVYGRTVLQGTSSLPAAF